MVDCSWAEQIVALFEAPAAAMSKDKSFKDR